MKNLLRFLGMLLCLLTALPSFAEEDRLQSLISQAEEAIARNDDEERNRIVEEIFVLTTGLDVKLEELLESYSAEELEKRLCIFYKAIAPLHTQEELEVIRHEARFRAFKLIKYGLTKYEGVRISLECVQNNGEPVPEAKALREGLVWAKRLYESDIAEAQAMAREYETLLKGHPDNEVYQWFNENMGLLVDGKRAHLNLEKSTQRVEILDYRRTFAEQADNGDVAIQIELARRLETGDKFEQNKMFAYYWFKRAQQNGGGEEPQKGLDRLRPLFTDVDLRRIENWIKKKYRMY